jgi:predicted RNase H-like HicB family nuclease
MKQRYHTIIRPERTGWFVGWVEEIPGTITQGRSLDECRNNLRDALQLMLETHRDEARLGMNRECILESIEIDVADGPPSAASGGGLFVPTPEDAQTQVMA